MNPRLRTVRSLIGLLALALPACSGADAPTLSAPMKAGAAVIAKVAIPTGWTFQSTSRSANVRVQIVDGVPLDVTTKGNKVSSVGWSAVSPLLTEDRVAQACQVIINRIEAAKATANAAETGHFFTENDCAASTSPSNPDTAANINRKKVFTVCYPIDATHCVAADVAIEGGAADRQVLLQLSVVDRGN